MRTLIWSRRSETDLFDIADRYSRLEPALPDILLDKIIASPEPLLERPMIGTPLGIRALRKWRVRGTPFILLYRVLGNDTIEIARVRHAREDWRPE